MDETTRDATEPTTHPSTLHAHAALIPAAARLQGAHKGWYFAVLVRAAYSRLEGAG
jgi:hypothetical protein